MQLLVKNIKLPFYAHFEDEVDSALRKKGVKGVKWRKIFKKSVDARKKPDIFFVYTVLCEATEYPHNSADIEPYVTDSFPENIEVKRHFDGSPVVVGFGPCGMFCALILARFGFNPIVIERGSDIDTRREKVEKFFRGEGLDTQSNVQFGEGGAGTFSDGKLITRVKDSRCSFVLTELVRHGAPGEILYTAKPHVGTDKLRDVVKSIRNEIISLGGKVMFERCVTDVKRSGNGYEIFLDGKESLYSPAVFLAAGHSAHDVYHMLMKNGISVVPKDYSVGFRAEHLQSDVDLSLYGRATEHKNAHLLPKGEYSLSYRKGDRGVYSFCMCPGGEVVASASEENTIVTNGMSHYARDGINANSAICISVLRRDYGDTPQGAMDFRVGLERAAFKLGGGDYRAPFQTVGDFLEGKATSNFGKIIPTYAMGVAGSDITKLFSGEMTSLFCEAIRKFGTQYSFFKNPDAPLTGVETRTSSPCRVQRGENLCIDGYVDFYPCGEGAGYAGGITSAALDGIRCAVEYITTSTK